MAKSEIRNGQREFGTVHVMEDEMREAGQGVFEAKSNAAPTNKARKAAPDNKDAAPALSGMTKPELTAEAERLKVAVDDDDTKADLIAKIEKKRG
jgi:hypothetical protein